MVEAHGLTNAGPVRKTNEDSFISDPALQLFMVADGMGGHAAGEVASSLAVETVLGFIRRTEEDAECSWPYGVEPALSFSSNRLRTAIHLANRRVFRAAERHDEYTGMGTTIVGAFISGRCLTVAERRRQPAVPVCGGAAHAAHHRRHLGGDDAGGATGFAACRAPVTGDAPRADECSGCARAGRRARQ